MSRTNRPRTPRRMMRDPNTAERALAKVNRQAQHEQESYQRVQGLVALGQEYAAARRQADEAHERASRLLRDFRQGYSALTERERQMVQEADL